MMEKRDYLPDISVIVSCYNQGQWLERCIRSISHQNGLEPEAFEILVIDDGSTDHTRDIIANLSILRNLRAIIHEKNQGLPNSLNHAIQHALGRYIVRVDADDYVQRNFLYIMKLFLDMNRDYQAVACDFLKVNRQEQVIGRFNCFEEKIACGIMFRKECLFDIGLYNESFKMREGHELRKRFELKYRIARLEFPFYRYRMHDSNRTKNEETVRHFDDQLQKS
ncbi:MAG: glycosyltransferase family 2 protein [Magnetococcales bacterium]|nr:glycosyltransferase family 2 protein [Magnetococcales bacterium]MBF0151521.1 glycosyltransferase family 2 protein [Magnetococcales bacterium]MBF0173808.1 glycosyltransferase family 2 protein [Magnetococcales bacterium]MBF0346754.1 glycosyltransferase family 2 protein [Magnetococcales bacterium]MBF0630998.1 glycosyltransferase family 2 protein [Magnetococcales bacterium]